ncbi:MAG: hypothetical protein ABI622_05125 [Chloroflexota bacterium]
MPIDRTPADRLDAAVDALLAGERAPGDAGLRAAISVAELLRTTLTPIPPGARFQAALGERIHGARFGERTLRAVTGTTRGRLIAAGAVSSAAVGVGVTAFAVWRTSRRQSGALHRLHR